jgi:hypothetical protein
MPESHRNSISRRRYRLAQSATVAGSLAVGALVVDRLVSYFRDDFLAYYGVSSTTEFHSLQQQVDAKLPLTLGQLVIASIALVSVIAFIATERRRLRQGCALDAACSRRSNLLVVERLSATSMFDAFIMRTSAFAGLLLSIWLLQSSIERWIGGFGLGLEYSGWTSLLPLASVFGLCVLAGMLVAAVSLVGLRVIHVLEVAFGSIRRRRLRPISSIPRPGFRLEDTARTLRELLGCDILSRPPPVAC